MARRLVVALDGVAKTATNYKIAVGGVVKPITKACVAMEGVVRQYYPYAEEPNPEDPRIVWDTTPITVIQQVADPADSIASIIFTRATGAYAYKNYPYSDGIGLFLQPALDGTPSDDDKYLIRVTQNSGTALTGVLATWIDLNSAATHEWSLDQTVAGASVAEATISIAEDDGLGAPVASTQVDKVVSFSSTVTAVGSDIVWSTTQRDLVEYKTGIDADCSITFSPNGFCTGSADTSGSFTEAWVNTPSNPENYDVTVSLVSGDAPSGTFDTPLSLDEVRQWVLATDGEEALFCELDVTVDDGIGPVTKRITMTPERSEIPDISWTTDPWACDDYDYPQPTALVGEIKVLAFASGHAELWMESTQLPLTMFETEEWFDGVPPDGNDYEVWVDGIGSGLPGYDEYDTWVRMTTNREFRIQYTTHPTKNFKLYIDVKFRKVGGIEVVKEITASTGKSDGGIAP